MMDAISAIYDRRKFHRDKTWEISKADEKRRDENSKKETLDRARHVYHEVARDILLRTSHQMGREMHYNLLELYI